MVLYLRFVAFGYSNMFLLDILTDMEVSARSMWLTDDIDKAHSMRENLEAANMPYSSVLKSLKALLLAILGNEKLS